MLVSWFLMQETVVCQVSLGTEIPAYTGVSQPKLITGHKTQDLLARVGPIT